MDPIGSAVLHALFVQAIEYLRTATNSVPVEARAQFKDPNNAMDYVTRLTAPRQFCAVSTNKINEYVSGVLLTVALFCCYCCCLLRQPKVKIKCLFVHVCPTVGPAGCDSHRRRDAGARDGAVRCCYYCDGLCCEAIYEVHYVCFVCGVGFRAPLPCQPLPCKPLPCKPLPCQPLPCQPLPYQLLPYQLLPYQLLPCQPLICQPLICFISARHLSARQPCQPLPCQPPLPATPPSHCSDSHFLIMQDHADVCLICLSLLVTAVSLQQGACVHSIVGQGEDRR